jgi:hypothetical protein
MRLFMVRCAVEVKEIMARTFHWRHTRRKGATLFELRWFSELHSNTLLSTSAGKDEMPTCAAISCGKDYC